MVKIKTLMVIYIVLSLVISIGFAQTKTPPKVQTNKASEKQSPSVKKKLPKDVPVVPLTNARITYDYIVFDFGYVLPGSKVTHSFPVRNTGTDTLNITKIKAG
jgi:hypothetical protein